jgi:hypothetical protein
MLSWIRDANPGKTILSLFISFCAEQSVMPALSQLAHQGIRQDVEYKVYIYAKEPMGALRWRFQTKTVGYNPFTKEVMKPYYSDWKAADCANSTVDGQIVSAIAQSGADVGLAEILRVVCGYSR